VVLDASALLALIWSEPGSERVAAVMDGAAISAVNWAETISKLQERGIDLAAASPMLELCGWVCLRSFWLVPLSDGTCLLSPKRGFGRGGETKP
jgi:uncharacterized protein with PIN domain